MAMTQFNTTSSSETAFTPSRISFVRAWASTSLPQPARTSVSEEANQSAGLVSMTATRGRGIRVTAVDVQSPSLSLASSTSSAFMSKSALTSVVSSSKGRSTPSVSDIVRIVYIQGVCLSNRQLSTVSGICFIALSKVSRMRRPQGTASLRERVPDFGTELF